MQKKVLLTEAGLYSLIMKSRKPIARQFEKWGSIIHQPLLVYKKSTFN